MEWRFYEFVEHGLVPAPIGIGALPVFFSSDANTALLLKDLR